MERLADAVAAPAAAVESVGAVTVPQTRPAQLGGGHRQREQQQQRHL